MAYPNKLDKFQSYNVHFVMLAARSTQDIQSFCDESLQSQSLSAIDTAKNLGDAIHLGDASSVYLLADTRRFSQFAIDNFEIDTLISGFTVPGSKNPNSTAIGMKFTVTDSTGVSFANFLEYLMDQKLQVSYDGMTLLLRILFVGTRDTGLTEVVQSLTIPAIFNSIQVDLNEVRGLYHCELFPLIGMASNSSYNSKWTNIGTASSYFSGTSNNTLGGVVNAFERRLNEESIKRYTQLNGTTAVDGGQKVVGHFGRQVQYMITLPTGTSDATNWNNFVFNGPGHGAATETNFKDLSEKINQTAAQVNAQKAAQTPAQAQKTSQANTAAPAKDTYVAVTPETSITEVLDIIFSQCTQVAQLGNFTHKADQNGDVRFYKHLITVTSDDDSFTVHVDVVEFVVPNVDLATKTTAVAQSDQDLYGEVVLQDGSRKRTPKQYIEFDYIFSGTNIDVLQLDLKIEKLNVLLQQGLKLGAGELFTGADQGQKPTDGTGVGTDTKAVFGLRAKDPTLIPRRSEGERTNFSSYGPNQTQDGDATPQAIAQQYTRNLSAFYGLSAVQTKMTIRGNPDLMGFVTLQALPKHVSVVTVAASGDISATNTTVKSDYRKAFEKDLLKLNGVSSDPVVGNNPSAYIPPPPPGGPISTQQLTGRNFVSSPFFVKVNIYGPNVTDFVNASQLPGVDYTKPLFYDNYYFVDKITSRIDGSRFTQEVSLRAFSVFEFPSTAAMAATTSTVKNK